MKTHYFEQAELGDDKKKFAGQTMAKCIKNVTVWDAPITSGKMAMKEIAGVGKGTGEIIDYVLLNKMWADKEGVEFYPQGLVDDETARKLNDDGSVPPEPKDQADRLEAARKANAQATREKKVGPCTV